jgi:hypothetical protein
MEPGAASAYLKAAAIASRAPRRRRLRAAHAALLVKETELAKALGLESCWS